MQQHNNATCLSPRSRWQPRQAHSSPAAAARHTAPASLQPGAHRHGRVEEPGGRDDSHKQVGMLRQCHRQLQRSSVPFLSPSQLSGKSGERVLNPQHSISQPWLCPNANPPEMLTCIRRHQLCRFPHFLQLSKVLKHPGEHHFACRAAAEAAGVQQCAQGDRA